MLTFEFSAVWRPILEVAAVMMAVLCGILLLLTYKLLFVLTIAIGLATALFVERAEHGTSRERTAQAASRLIGVQD